MILIVLIIVVLGILTFRVYRLIHFYKEANSNTVPEHKRVARINYIIHLVFCLILLLLIRFIIYGFILMSYGEV
jgi:hypothetical protein